MLEPDYLSNITFELEEMYYNLETEVIKDIAERIKLNNYNMTSTAEYQKAVLQSLGKSQSQIIDEISKTLNISKRKVKDIIAKSSYRAVETDNEIFELAFKEGKIPSFNYSKESLKAIINSGIKALNTELGNICKTTAKSCQNAFIQASNEAYLAIQSGAFSYDQAITNVVKKLSRQGLGVIEYRSGARRRLDGAIRNAVRTAINQTACKCQDKNFFDMGGNLVEVTSHAGARPAHAEWQGQIYWRKEKYKNYRNFEQTTGYGTGDGLGGWNCRHSFYPYFEGLSTPSFKKYNLKENEEFYNLTQEQRYNERMIREWDRRNQICKSAGVDNSKESAKIREWKKRQTDFLKEHPELKRVYAQEKGYINTKYTAVFNDKGLKKSIKADPKYDGIPSTFKYSKEKENNLLNSFIEIDNKALSTGYEYIAVLDSKTGLPIFPLATNKSNKTVNPSSEAIAYLLNAPLNSVTTVHNHPSTNPFSSGDIITHNRIKSLSETIVINSQGICYYFSIPKNARINLETRELQEQFKLYVSNTRNRIRSEHKNLSTVDVYHLAWKVIAEEKGWYYGRKRLG
ncbi:phage minor capsid protein [Thomasclavelia cocleata]|uniref:phage minor capsid protein n=1 Tax=Thomasclavelia cocleata TaxID=69824 RepID=UPI002575DEAD|nr:phage minor capsid protein [Thomasclavelia cocleata]